MSVNESEKARRYITALDDAKCQGRWQEIQELARKVNKHAPHRKCLTLASTTEAQLATNGTSRPGTATSTTSPLSEIATQLETVIEETTTLEDVYQAKICLAYLYATLDDSSAARTALPQDIKQGCPDLGDSTGNWTDVCLVKGAFLSLSLQQSSLGQVAAISQARSIGLDIVDLGKSTSSQKTLWSSAYLKQVAVLAATSALSSDEKTRSSQPADFALQAFRLWTSRFSGKAPQTSQDQVEALTAIPSDKQAWHEYYELLSQILQQSVLSSALNERSARGQLIAEFRRTEAQFESILLRDLKFPKATENNWKIEAFVERVILNWKVLCGPGWTDADFGEGGQDAVGRNMLDILYRAATKSFHSTIILRYLFYVHCSLSEFDLGLKALDSYIEISTRVRIRAEKSDEEADSLDPDSIYYNTIADGVKVLSCFGSKKEAEKAIELASLLEEWANKQSIGSEQSSQASEIDGKPSNAEVLEALASVYAAIGIAFANWARWTPESESRDNLQVEAASYLKKALMPDHFDQPDIETSFALGLLLAERREISSAVDLMKKTLAMHSQGETQPGYARERSLVPLWHLLSLLLSARQDYDTAEQACEAALAQFPSPATLFGSRKARRTSSYSDNEKPEAIHVPGLVDEMSHRERERLLEIRMTELALTEVLDGPEIAVNSSNELIGLYARLFGPPPAEEKPKAESLIPPKTATGTIRSFRGSVFGRRRMDRSEAEFQAVNETPSVENRSRQASLTNPPTIQVTDDTNGDPEKQNSGVDGISTVRSKASAKARNRSQSRSRANSARNSARNSAQIRDMASSPTAPAVDQVVGVPMTSDLATGSALGPVKSGRQSLPDVAHNIDHSEQPPPIGHDRQPPVQDVRLPTVNPGYTRLPPRFSKPQVERHALTILIKIWLLVAGLYRRSSMYEDAQEAINEASNAAAKMENLVGAQESTAKSFAERGWGSSESSDELWADVYAERGLLSQAQSSNHEAMDLYEQALTYYPNHVRATIALSTLLLDIYDQTLAPEPPKPKLEASFSSITLTTPTADKAQPSTTTQQNGFTHHPSSKPSSVSESTLRKTPEALNRLAARDRAYGLLSRITKSGSGWDNSEAWFALARAHEESGQVEKAKEVLWWCVELEDRKPVRHWSNLGSGGYVL